MAAHSSINEVRFSLANSVTIQEDSVVPVINHEIKQGDLPYKQGICDAHMGPFDTKYNCQTCFQGKKLCPGHPGHISLNTPVWSPIGAVNIRKWLIVICFNCGKCITTNVNFVGVPLADRLKKTALVASKAAKGKQYRDCAHCGTPHPHITFDQSDRTHIYETSKGTEKSIILPHRAYAIFDRISDETVLELGQKLESHPRNLLLYAIPFPPVTVRPETGKQGTMQSRKKDNGMNTAFQLLVRKNAKLQAELADQTSKAREASILEINSIYYQTIRAKSGSEEEFAMSNLHKGKKGRHRLNQLGKKTTVIARDTIVGHPSIKMDEICIPLMFARTLQFEEPVQIYNIRRCYELIRNGRNVYPGATAIIKKSTGTQYTVTSDDIELEYGDIIFRDLIDGDPVLFNRQPSLAPSNIASHRIKVITDETTKPIGMNPLVVPYYGADFDGDQMNIIVGSDLPSRVEMSHLSSVPNWFIKIANSVPALGQAEDSLLGLFHLTRSNVKYSRIEAAQVFASTTMYPDLSKYEFPISGRDLVSIALEHTPISLKRSPTWYNPNFEHIVKYRPDEKVVEIKNGKLLRGVLDKATVGKESRGGIYHLVERDYGAVAALNCLFDMQQIGLAHIAHEGFSLGIGDFMLPRDTKMEVDRITQSILVGADAITDELNRGDIVPPINKTTEQFYEERMIEALKIVDEYTEAVLGSIDHNENSLYKIIACGSKGKIEQMLTMMAAPGPKLITGERMPEKFGPHRTFPFAQRYSTDPVDRGYITNSYVSGMTVKEYITSATETRSGLIAKVLNTSVTGEQNRNSCMNLGSDVTNNFRATTKGSRAIVQPIYGEDGLDSRKIESAQFPTVMMSDDKFAQFGGQYTEQYREFYAKMAEDRKIYRDVYRKFEDMNPSKDFISDTKKMPINLGRVIDDLMAQHGQTQTESLPSLVARVEKYIDDLPRVFTNERDTSPILAHNAAACWLMQMLIRTHLHPAALVTIGEKRLEVILDKISTAYARALIDPGTAVGIIAAQSFSDPLTQYMLDAHHRSALGGTSKSSMTEAKEILNAKMPEDCVGPTMLITLVNPDEKTAQHIANNIEMMTVRQFVSRAQIFYEKYGQPVHSGYSHESAFIADFNKKNPATVPGDLTRWCIRLSLNKINMVLKSMSVSTIVAALKRQPGYYVVYTQDTAVDLIVRVYLRRSVHEKLASVDDVKVVLGDALDLIVRGVRGIVSAMPRKIPRSKIAADGSITRTEEYAVSTTGTNFVDVVTFPGVEPSRVDADNPQEVCKYLGIEAARQKILSRLRRMVDGNSRHPLVYADEMTITGRVTNIELAGMKAREPNGLLQRMAFKAPMKTLEDATLGALHDQVVGTAAPLLLGSVPKHGTIYNSISINEEFVAANTVTTDAMINKLFED